MINPFSSLARAGKNLRFFRKCLLVSNAFFMHSMFFCVPSCHYLCACTQLTGNIFVIAGRGGALVKSMTLKRRVVGSTPVLAATKGPWASPLTTVACALRRETSIQHPCCSRERL